MNAIDEATLVTWELVAMVKLTTNDCDRAVAMLSDLLPGGRRRITCVSNGKHVAYEFDGVILDRTGLEYVRLRLDDDLFDVAKSGVFKLDEYDQFVRPFQLDSKTKVSKLNLSVQKWHLTGNIMLSADLPSLVLRHWQSLSEKYLEHINMMLTEPISQVSTPNRLIVMVIDDGCTRYDEIGWNQRERWMITNDEIIVVDDDHLQDSLPDTDLSGLLFKVPSFKLFVDSDGVLISESHGPNLSCRVRASGTEEDQLQWTILWHSRANLDGTVSVPYWGRK